MSTQFEQIIESFLQRSATLEATCQMLARESQADPARTRFWGQRVETELKRGRIDAATARTMLDALEGFQCDKTMWLDPSLGLSRNGPAATNTAASASPPAPLHSSSLDIVPLGTVMKDRYRLVAHLGAGGIGQVFDAIDLAEPTETHVTLKIVAVNLKQQPYAFDALTAAVRQAQHLDHPNIVRVLDIDHHEDRVFITMEPLRGRWLSGIVREARNKGMAYEAAWPIIEGIANGLAHAHSHGIVHSDLSPHAVFICEDGTPKIVGFGLIHAVPASNESLDVLDTLTLRAYTEAYTADAWAQQGKPHAADDLYPLGVIAYEMLTGMHPFARCSLAVARQKGLTCARIELLNRREHKLIERCLSFDREARPKDGLTFLKRMRPGMFERLRVATGVSV